MRRIYQPFVHATAGSLLELSEDARHHLLTVLRSREDEMLVVFNGQGQAWRARIASLTRKTGQVELLEPLDQNPESPLKIHLAQAVSKGDRMDFVMQKATELGVTSITPILTERGNVKLDAGRWEKKLAHWQQILIHACEQSGRTTLPVLHPVIDLRTWFTQLPEGLRFILSPHAKAPLADRPPPSDLTLLIGPEGGLTDQEVTLATERFNFDALQLGPRILRTETAAIAALSVLQYAWGDLTAS